MSMAGHGGASVELHEEREERTLIVDSSDAEHHAEAKDSVGRCQFRLQVVFVGFTVIFLISMLVSIWHDVAIKKAHYWKDPTAVHNSETFLVVGDWGRNGMYDQGANADAMAGIADKFNASFVVSPGDNFYETGIKDATDPQVMTSWTNIYKAASLRKAWYSVLGNHDYAGSIDAQINLPDPVWNMPARNYSKIFTLPDETAHHGASTLHMLFIDTTPFVAKYREAKYSASTYGSLQANLKTACNGDATCSTQLTWISETLAKETEATWTVVVGHHPVYSDGKYRGTPELQAHKGLKDLLVHHKVHAYISGHEHNLQYHDDGTGVQYFVSGAGSKVEAVSSDMKSAATSKFSEGKTQGFLSVSANSTMMQVELIDRASEVVFRKEIHQAFYMNAAGAGGHEGDVH